MTLVVQLKANLSKNQTVASLQILQYSKKSKPFLGKSNQTESNFKTVYNN